MDKDVTKKLFYVIGWTLFFLVIIILGRLTYKDNNQTIIEDTNYISLEDGFSALSINNYVYNSSIYDITNDILINYTGKAYGAINVGSKISNGVLNYYSDGIAYYNSETKEVINIYDNYLSYFLIPINVYNYVKNLDYETKIDSNKKVYIYNNIYQDLPISINIFVNENNITDINYTYNNVEYKCNYSDIGKVEELVLP